MNNPQQKLEIEFEDANTTREKLNELVLLLTQPNEELLIAIEELSDYEKDTERNLNPEQNPYPSNQYKEKGR